MSLQDLQALLDNDKNPELEAKKQVLQQSISAGTESEPNQQAKVIQLSAKTGLAPNTIADSYPEVDKKQKVLGTDYNDLVNNHQGLSQFLSNPINASVAHDDIENLKNVSSAVSHYNQEGSFVDAPLLGWYNTKKHLWQAAKVLGLFDDKDIRDGISYNNMMAQSIQEEAPEYVKIKNKRLEEISAGKELADITSFTGLDEVYNGQIKKGLADFANGAIGQVGGLLDRVSQEGINYKATAYEMASSPVDLGIMMLSGGLGESAAKSIIGDALSPLGKKAAFAVGSALGSLFPNAGKAMDEFLQENNVDQSDPLSIEKAFSDPDFVSKMRNQAIKGGLIKSATVASLPFLSGGKGLVGKAVDVGKMAGVFAGGEAAEQVGKDLPFDFNKIMNNFYGGLSQGVVFEGGFSAYRKLFSPDPVQAIQEITDKTNDSLQNIKNIQLIREGKNALEKSLNEGKLAKRVPGMTQDMISQINPNAKIYFNVKDFDEILAAKGIPPAEMAAKLMGDEGKAYQQEKNRGGELSIPLGKYMSELFSNPLFDDLEPMSKDRYNGETAKQSGEFLEKVHDTVSEVAKESIKPEQSAPITIPEAGEPLPEALQITKQELEKALDYQGFYSSVDNPETLGMTGEKAQRLLRAKQDWMDAATKQLSEKIIEDKNRQRRTLESAERKSIRDKVEKEINARPEFIASSVLSTGRMPDGSELYTGVPTFKLNREELVSQYGKNIVGELPRASTAEGGVLADEAAGQFGYDSGEELIEGLKIARDPKSFIDRLTDAKMHFEHPDLTKPIDLSEEAMKAIHNEKRQEITRLSMEHLVSNDLPVLKDMIRSTTKKLQPNFQVKLQAKQEIGSTAFEDLNPDKYLKTEARKTREASEALAKLDMDAVVEAKKQERLNGELYRKAVEVKEELGNDLKYVNRFNKDPVRMQVGKYGKGYLDQIDSLMSRFGLGENVPDPESSSLSEWVTEQKKKGYQPAFSDAILNENNKQDYKKLTTDQLRDVINSIQSIDRIGKQYGEMLANAKYKQFDELRDLLFNTAGKHFDLTIPPRDYHPNFKDRIVSGGKGFFAAHIKPEFIFRHLDGHENLGPFHQSFFQPTVESEKVENNFRREIVENTFKVFEKHYTEEERADFGRNKIYIKSLKGTGLHPNVTRQEILAVGFNLRNEYNRSTLKNWGLNDSHIMEISSHLDTRDINFINDMGDYIESWWPRIKAHEESINGIAPERVTGDGFVTPNGIINGGYYPLVRDTKFSLNQLDEQLRLSNTKELLSGNKFANAMTLHSHTFERENFGDNKPLLQLDVIPRTFSNIAHDLAWRKTIIDLHKLANDSRIETAIRGAAGDEMYKQINPWIRSMANSNFGEPPNPVEQILSRIRRAQTIGTIGWKVSSAAIHTSTLPVNFKEIGSEYAMRGIKRFYGDPLSFKENMEFITSRDQTMKDRFEMNNYDRDIYYTYEKSLNAIGTKTEWERIAHNIGLEKIQETGFVMMKYADISVSAPLWFGAYERAMDGEAGPNIKAGDEKAAIDYAGSTVRMVKGSGSAKDLASIQRGTEFWKNVTMFYSAASSSLQQMADTGLKFQHSRNIPQLIAGIVATAMMPSYMMSMIKGKMPNPTKDPKEFALWMAETPVEFAAHGLIAGRDLAHFVENYSKYGKQYATVHLIPGEQSMEQVGKTIVTPMHLLKGKKITRDETKALLDSIELLAPFPSQQTWQTSSYLYDWEHGKQKPSNPLEGIYRATLAGPASKKKH